MNLSSHSQSPIASCVVFVGLLAAAISPAVPVVEAQGLDSVQKTHMREILHGVQQVLRSTYSMHL